MSRYPKKLFYKIGEVCEICGVEAHVLRYWESEFPVLTPTRNKSGQRIYRQKDLDVIDAIKRLLYQEGYTIAGASRQLLEQGVGNGQEFPLFRKRKMTPAEIMADVREILEDLLRILGRDRKAGAGPESLRVQPAAALAPPGTQLVMSEVLLTEKPVEQPQPSPDRKLSLKVSGLTTES